MMEDVASYGLSVPTYHGVRFQKAKLTLSLVLDVEQIYICILFKYFIIYIYF
jgi:hypothetical protein